MIYRNQSPKTDRLRTGLISMFILFFLESASFAADSVVWQNIEEATLLRQGQNRLITPDKYNLVAVDIDALDNLISQAPLESANQIQSTVLSIPLPDGTVGRFQIVESPMMAPALAAKFPEIKTYRGFGLDDTTATARFDRTPAGFHGFILSVKGSVYIDPYQQGNVTNYMSYYKQDNSKSSNFEEGLTTDENSVFETPLTSIKSGNVLRTFRLALAAGGGYTQFHGGTVNGALAAMTTTLNRVNAIYEREFSARMELIANNDQIIYTDPATDPYTGTSVQDLQRQNQINVDNVIGNGNYDIGHLFYSFSNGGNASVGSLCNNSRKAQAVTTSYQPVGDNFDVDYVAHEMGHQFGANHTFNATDSSNCSEQNKVHATAYEPGSGSTIQAYAGLCDSQDLQEHSDDYFHGISFDQIMTHMTTMGCATETNTNNNAPVVEAGPNYTIPASTPFILEGSATDINGDTLTYTWEQFDLGPGATGTLPNRDDGSRPIFRSYPPVTTPVRIFPNFKQPILAKIGESLPTTDRSLHFRLTARDGKGGVNNDSMIVSVVSSAGPFQVTAPNTRIFWNIGDSKNVTWNVANTNVGVVNCTTVNILLSTDSGNSFPVTLKANTANDGSELITVPANATTKGRIKVACATNIFFDMSDTDFSIGNGSEIKNDIVIDFGTSDGIKMLLNNNTWTSLHSLSADSMATGDIDGNHQDEVIIDFGASQGISLWMNNSAWVQLDPFSARSMVTGDIDGSGQDDVIVDFKKPDGIWVWMNNNLWVQLDPFSARSMVTGDIDGSGQDDVLVDFEEPDGLWVWKNNNTWVQLDSDSADSMVTGDIDGSGQDDVIIDFGPSLGDGVWVFQNNSTWTQLRTDSPGNMTTGDIDGSGQDDVIMDFSTGILALMNNNLWVQLHSQQSESMVTGDLDSNGQDDVIVDLGASSGIWEWMNNSTWIQLHSQSPDSMVTGNID